MTLDPAVRGRIVEMMEVGMNSIHVTNHLRLSLRTM
jgi:hypothetical protein